MDIEQLKLLLEAVNQTTGDAKQVIIWFLSYNLVKVLLGYGLGLFGIIVGARLVRFVADAISQCDTLRQIRGSVVAGKSKYERVTPNDLAAIYRALDEERPGQ